MHRPTTGGHTTATEMNTVIDAVINCSNGVQVLTPGNRATDLQCIHVHCLILGGHSTLGGLARYDPLIHG